MRHIVSAALLLAAAACATAPGTPTAPSAAAAAQALPHDPVPEAKLDPATCPMIAILGPLQVQFPARALEIGQEGWVRLRFDVDANGVATNIEQLGASPPGVFDAAARETLVKARFLSVNSRNCEFVLDYRKDPPK